MGTVLLVGNERGIITSSLMKCASAISAYAAVTEELSYEFERYMEIDKILLRDHVPQKKSKKQKKSVYNSDNLKHRYRK